MNYKIYFDSYFNESLAQCIYSSGRTGEVAEELFLEVKDFCLKFEQFPDRMMSANVNPESLKFTWFEKNKVTFFYLAALVDDGLKEVTFVAAGSKSFGREAFIKGVARSV